MSSTAVAAGGTLSAMATDNRHIIQAALAQLIQTGDAGALVSSAKPCILRLLVVSPSSLGGRRLEFGHFALDSRFRMV